MVVKYYYPDYQDEYFKELKNYNILNKFIKCPELLFHDNINKLLIFEFIENQESYEFKSNILDKVFEVQNSLQKCNEFQIKKNKPLQFYDALAISKFKYIDKKLLKYILKFRHKYKYDSIIHGDLKLDNILINPNNDLIVLDFENLGIGDKTFELSYFFSSLVLYKFSFFEVIDFTSNQTLNTFLKMNPFLKIWFLEIYKNSPLNFRNFLLFLSINIIWRIVIDNKFEKREILNNYYYQVAREYLLIKRK